MSMNENQMKNSHVLRKFSSEKAEARIAERTATKLDNVPLGLNIEQGPKSKEALLKAVEKNAYKIGGYQTVGDKVE